MHRSMTSNPAGQSSQISIITKDSRRGIVQSGIPIIQEAIVSQVLVRGASSLISLTQRAPGIWSLTASSILNINQITQGPPEPDIRLKSLEPSETLHTLNHTASSSLTFINDVDTAGGRIYIPNLVIARSNAGLIITRSDACLVVILDRP